MYNDFSHKTDTLFINCRLATMTDGNLGIIENGALAISGNTISFAGNETELPKGIKFRLAPPQIIDCQNRWILPGFVDCHTHLVWAGSRTREFSLRLQGASYEEILKSGGGILSTVSATRKASSEELFSLAAERLDTLISQGITTVEIKSGYGLDLKNELKILCVIKELDNNYPVQIEPTFLGAHTLPPEFTGKPDQYVELIIETMLPAVKDQGIATSVDVFCERIGFSTEQTKKIFQSAKDSGFKLKLHAEQLSNTRGAQLAAEFQALSCDHLEYLSLKSARKMAENNVTAVLLPGAFYYLHETQLPPVQVLRDLKIPIALATDLNPGSSPVFSMMMILNLACNLFGLTCEESLLAATINGAKALGLENSKGSLEPGKDADLVLWEIDEPGELCYLSGPAPVKAVMVKGEFILDNA